MIRAHMASFPPRRAVMLEAARALAPQVDRLFVCLNEHAEVPEALARIPRVEPWIPARDLKDAGKFAFAPGPDDTVLTVDDDIRYPPDYVARSLEAADLDAGPCGYQAHSWVWRARLGRRGWRNFMYWKRRPRALPVHILGTGTALMRGADMPSLAAMEGAAGFVDLRFARLMAERGQPLMTLPREEGWMGRNLPEDLKATSLFETVARRRPPALRAEHAAMMAALSPLPGEGPPRTRPR